MSEKLTPQEAIESIKCNYPPPNYSILRESLDISIEALEKQIPKKPFLESKKGIATIAMWHCPVCKNEIISNWNRDIANSYCHHCGQAILWE